MRISRLSFRLIQCLLVACLVPWCAAAQDLPAPFTKRLVAYYGSWSKYQSPAYSASQIPYQKLTHIIHAGINLNEPADGSFTIPATGFIEPELLMKAHANGVKVLFYVGAYSGEDYSIVAANPTYRTTFITQLKNVIATYKYDGIDIDWEYPNGSADAANFVTFFSEIRKAFPSSDFLTSTDVPNYPSSGIDFVHLTSLLSWYNIMMYDAAGPWDGYVEVNSPIFDDPANPNDQGSVSQAADDFLNLYNVPAAKLNMGTPFYGYDYKDQTQLFQVCKPCNNHNVPSYNYAPFIKDRINKKGWVSSYDPVEAVPFLVRADGSDGFITYDDAASTFHRVYYSLWQRNLGGVFMWSLDADYDGNSQDLLDAMYLAALGGNVNPY